MGASPEEYARQFAGRRAAYTDPAAARESVRRLGTLRDQAERVCYAIDVCRAPRGRYGLDSVAPDVLAAYLAEGERLSELVGGLADDVAGLRANGASWGQVWFQLSSNPEGFSYDDGALLLRVARRAF